MAQHTFGDFVAAPALEIEEAGVAVLPPTVLHTILRVYQRAASTLIGRSTLCLYRPLSFAASIMDCSPTDLILEDPLHILYKNPHHTMV